MIECIFTVDYEIFGNGEGSLRELVYEPAEKLKAVFEKWGSRLVTFVEAAELETIERQGSDDAIEDVRRQIADLHRQGHEIGLHIHPQWYNARLEKGKWLLDYTEYNLCVLPRERIVEIVQRSIAYLRDVLGVPDYSPLSFRAGNWLLQPTMVAAEVLFEMGVRIDSSVFKGGRQRSHGLDYRRALENGYHWRFSDDVNVQDLGGGMTELPTYSQMMPSWRMATPKRLGKQRARSATSQGTWLNFDRILDLMRLRYPLKLDYCRMTRSEFTSMLDGVIRADKKDPATFRPIVAIGHTKDLDDVEALDFMLSYVRKMGVAISTFEKVYARCQ